MGGAASCTDVNVDENDGGHNLHELSKDEIQEIFTHMKGEYNRKISEILHRSGKQRVKEVEVRKRLFLKAMGLMPDIGEQVQEKALLILGDDDLTRQSQNALPENSKVTAKVVKQLGDVTIASEKVKDRLGTNMTQEQIQRMKEHDVLEAKMILERKMKELKQVLLAKPARDMMDVPTEKPIPTKARDMMGDEHLEQTAMKLVDPSGITAKALKLVGEASMLVPNKAARMIGSELDQRELEKMREAEEREKQRQLNLKLHELNVILQANPSLQQLEVKAPLTRKIQDKLGDEVVENGRHVVPNGGQNIGKKELQLLGDDERLLADKVAKFRGGEMTQEQIDAMKREEEAERKRMEKKNKMSLRNLLEKAPSTAQLERPMQHIGSKVAIKKFGHEFLPGRRLAEDAVDGAESGEDEL